MKEVMGHIKSGTMTSGDALAIVSLGDITLPNYTGSKDKPRLYQDGGAGEYVDIYVRGVCRDGIECG